MVFNNLFAKYVIEHKLLDDALCLKYNKIATEQGIPLYKVIVKNEPIYEEKVYRLLASFLGFEFRMIQLTEVNLETVSLFPKEKLLEYYCIPLDVTDSNVTFVISNPFMIDEIEGFKSLGYKDFTYILSTGSQVGRIIDYVINKNEQNQLYIEYDNEDYEEEKDSEDVEIDAPVIKICDNLLKEAVSRGTSDIHIEPFEEDLVIRFRIDGRLEVTDPIPRHLYSAILARFKIMANMNIAERRIPQDGKISLEINGIDYDFRVSTIPTIHGEKIVIRIYNVSFARSDMGALGFNTRQQALIKEMITRPHGIILLTGPTGSGKSTTLYSFLRYLNTEDTNIITVEDPVENEIKGINQVQVNPKANLTFATALRSILRQDPNIIMIGEIRDEETAQIATRAAITGHLVLSSIHTNDVAGVVTRLINMGIPKYLVADSLLGAISQRLVKKLCPKCKKKRRINLIEKQILGIDKDVNIYESVGCPYCNHTGYFGRTAVFEMMIVDDEMRDLIMDPDFTSEKLSKLLEKNTQTILDSTREKVLDGETTIDEYKKLMGVIENKNDILKEEDN